MLSEVPGATTAGACDFLFSAEPVQTNLTTCTCDSFDRCFECQTEGFCTQVCGPGTIFSCGGGVLPPGGGGGGGGTFPTISSVSSFSAQVGQTVTLTGNNLGNATQVRFGGIPAAFTVNAANGQVTATVPPGASTGLICVVTPSGTAQTAQNFVPVQVAAALRQAQSALANVADQLLQGLTSRDFLESVANGADIAGNAAGALALILGAEGTGTTLTGVGALIGVPSLAGAVGATGVSVIAKGSATLIRGLLEQQYYAAKAKVDILKPGGNPIGRAGSSPEIRELTGDQTDALNLFMELIEGGTEVPTPNFKGFRFKIPGDGTVQIRDFASKSPNTNATIDVKLKSVPDIEKLKFNP